MSGTVTLFSGWVMDNGDEKARGPARHEAPPGARPRRESALPFTGGLLVGVALLGLIWVFVALLGGGSDQSADQVTSHEVNGPVAGSPAAQGAQGNQGTQGTSATQGARAAQPHQSRLERCNDAAAALTLPLRAARPSMDQWAVHIGAMNKLVAGAISLQQATAFWQQTRTGAQNGIDRFRQAMRTLRRHGVDCPSPGLLTDTASPPLRACVRQVAADLRALETVRTAVGTWQMHVQDMERLRQGTLSPSAAARMWLSMWQSGVRQLDDYRVSSRTARQIGGCSTGRPTTSQAPSTGMPGMPGMTSTPGAQ